MQLELTDEKAAALLALLNRTIENDRYPLSPRIRVMRGIRGSCRARRPNRRRSDRREPAGHAVDNSKFTALSARPANDGARPYRLLATVLNVLVKLVPTDVIIAMAATAISAAIRPYSIAVTPLSFSMR